MSGPKTPATFICAEVSRRAPIAVGRFCLAALLLMLIPDRPVIADEANSDSVPSPDAQSADSHALSTIFQDEVIQDNSISIQNSAARLPAAERFELLTNWVLPGNLHPTFRVTGKFGSTGAPPVAEQSPKASPHLTPGVAVLSPAVDLVAAARSLGRLTQLRQQILTTDVSADDAQQNYVKATLLFLVDVARDDFAAATLAFDEVIARSMDIDDKSVEFRWPALLMLRAAISSSNNSIRRHVTEFFFSTFLDLRDFKSDFRRDVLNDHLRTMFSLNQFIGKAGSFGTRQFSLTEQWIPFGYSDSETRGNGRPTARWHSDNGRVQKIAGHEFDYLSFSSPLRGNFEVECDFSTPQGRQFSFMVAGTRLHTSANRDALVVGNFRKYATQQALEKALTKFKQTARFRAVIRDGWLTYFMNGEPVLKRQLPKEHNPWVAIRSWRRSLGTASDFRITGEPVIPDEIHLTGDPELSGWAPYFEAGFGAGKGNWQTTDDGQGGTGILGLARPEYEGSAVQKLLRYCRPVAEDGTIDYEFYYKQGEACVHPALDRVAFLLEPGGVKIHWITDRRYERFDRDPANVSEQSENRVGPAELPLLENAWNHLKLDVTGDTVRLVLNGQAIYKYELHASNQRTFGLFHYADRTVARVRSIVWRGDWPKQLPAIQNQDLADTSLDFLDESRSELTAHFHHDFRKDSLFERFDLSGDESGLEQTDDGTRATLKIHTGAKQLKSALRISGDFDITATFQDLDLHMEKPRWELRAGFVLHFNSDVTDVCGLYRILARNKDNRRVSFVHSSRPENKPHTVRGSFDVEESKSGRLRLARRGSAIYAMYAAGNSSNFRLVDQREVTDRPLAVQGLRMILMSSTDAHVGVTWKNLDVRAEEISGLPLSEPAPIVAALNTLRDSLPARNIEFVDAQGVAEKFWIGNTGDPILTAKSDDGVRITNTAGDASESCILVSKVPFGRGVDVELKLDVHQLGHPDSLATKSEIAMKVFFETAMRDNSGPIEATFILRQTKNGARDLITRIVSLNAANRKQYQEMLALPVKSPDAFRTVVHEGTLYFLYSEAGSDEYRIATTAPVIDNLPATGVELKFVANGKDHKSDLTLKNLIVHESETLRADLND